MDKQTLTEMLQSIRKDNMIGPTGASSNIIDQIDFALDHGLVTRTYQGNFVITSKGLDLLEGKLNWENI